MVKPEYEALLGIPFAYHGRGEDSYDCYGLLMKLYKDFSNVEITDYASEEKMELIALLFANGIAEWRETDEREGVAVLMRVSGYGAHVGYCIGEGMFIHTWEKSGGVVIERLDTWKRRIIGYYDYA